MSDLEAAVAAGVLGADEAHRALLQATVEVARAIFGAKAASVFLLDEDAEELVFEAVAGEGEGELIGMRFPAGTGIAGWVLTTRQPLVVDDLSADTRFSRSAAESTGYVPKSMMAVPLLVEERALGVLSVLDRPEETKLRLAEVDLLGLFANQAAIALDLLQRARRARAALAGEGRLAPLARVAAHLEEREQDAAFELLRALDRLLGRDVRLAREEAGREPGGHDVLGGRERRSVARHGGDEVLPLDGVDPERLDGSHGRRARDVAQQRDLAEEVARPELARRAVVELHRRCSGCDRVEVVARLRRARPRPGSAATDTVVAPPASRSSTGSGSCAKISILRSSSSGSSAITASASIRRRLGQSQTSRTGSTEPAAISAPRGPSQSTRPGVTSEPIASPAMSRLSWTAKTRPMTSFSAERCSRVTLLTCTKIAPAPSAPTRTSAGAREETAAQSASGTAESRSPIANPPARRRRVAMAATTKRADDAADADGGVQPAQAGVATVQQPDREHDEQAPRALRRSPPARS